MAPGRSRLSTLSASIAAGWLWSFGWRWAFSWVAARFGGGSWLAFASRVESVLGDG